MAIHITNPPGYVAPPPVDYEAEAAKDEAAGRFEAAAYVRFVSACNRGEVRHTGEAWAEWKARAAEPVVVPPKVVVRHMFKRALASLATGEK